MGGLSVWFIDMRLLLMNECTAINEDDDDDVTYCLTLSSGLTMTVTAGLMSNAAVTMATESNIQKSFRVICNYINLMSTNPEQLLPTTGWVRQLQTCLEAVGEEEEEESAMI